MRFLLTTLLILITTLGFSQDFRERTSGIRSEVSAIVKAGEKLNFPVPDLIEDEEGYYILFCSHANNIDIIFICGPTISQAELNEAGKKLALDLGWTQADFLYRERPKSRFLDIELNDYLVREGGWAKEDQSFTFPVGAVCRALAKTPVGGKPWIVSIDPDGVDEANVAGATGSLDPKYGALYRMADVPDSATFSVKTSISWYHRLFGLLCPLAFLSMIAMPLVVGKRSLKRMAAVAEQMESDNAHPRTRQERYNKESKKPWMHAIQALPLLAIVLLPLAKGQTESYLDKAMTSVPYADFLFSDLRRMLVFMLILGVLMVGSAFLVKRNTLKKLPELKLPEPDVPPVFRKLMLVAAGIFVFMLTLMFIPGFVSLPAGVRTALLMGPPLLAMASMPFVIFRATTGNRTRLAEGDRWFDEVMRMGERAGVRVRAVFISDLDKSNAFATALNSVVITKGLLSSLSDQEVRAVAAHEVGHLRYRHPVRSAVLSLITLGGILALDWILMDRIPRDAALGPIVHSPALIWIAVPLTSLFWTNRRSQQHELEADRFAIEIVGDPDVMIMALFKITEDSKAVHQLSSVDQRMSSHPSLNRRIKAIQGAFPGAGAFLVEDPSGALTMRTAEG